MRWNQKKPEFGDRKVCGSFLLFPKCIEGEFRWLEYAYWEERYGHLGRDKGDGWSADRWLTRQEAKAALAFYLRDAQKEQKRV
jgi:hypothetical protein